MLALTTYRQCFFNSIVKAIRTARYLHTLSSSTAALSLPPSLTISFATAILVDLSRLLRSSQGPMRTFVGNDSAAFRSTDFLDIHHASAALPYCDFFLTERFLGTALSRRPLAFDEHFACSVFWDEAEALAALQQSAG